MFFGFPFYRGWRCFVLRKIDTKSVVKKSLGFLILEVNKKHFFDQKFGAVDSEVGFWQNV